MTIEVKNAEVIVKVLKGMLDKARANLKTAVDDEVTRMIRRTREGKDVDGGTFAPYTPAYNKFKASFKSGFVTRNRDPKKGGFKKGKNAKQVKERTLQFAETRPYTFGQHARVYPNQSRGHIDGGSRNRIFNSALEAAKAQGNQKKRRFFGFAENSATY